MEKNCVDFFPSLDTIQEYIWNFRPSKLEIKFGKHEIEDNFRWWRQFECLPWPEDLLSILCMVIPNSDEKSQRRRHAIARYVNLSSALAWFV